jgi:hypothetical protein
LAEGYRRAYKVFGDESIWYAWEFHGCSGGTYDREGYHPSKDDYFPPRCFDEPVSDKYGKTWVWEEDEFEASKKEYYVDNLKLTELMCPSTKSKNASC